MVNFGRVSSILPTTDRPLVGCVSLFDVHKRKISGMLVLHHKIAVHGRHQIPRWGSAKASRYDHQWTVGRMI